MEKRHTPSIRTKKNRTNLNLPLPRSGSTPNLNMSLASTGNRNSEETLSKLHIANCSFIRPSSKPNTVEEDWARQFLYNDYLQEKMKALIITKTIKKHEQSMQKQLNIWKEQLEKLTSIHSSMCQRIDSYKQRSQLVEFIDILKDGLQEFDILCDRYSIFSNATELNELLSHESNLVCLKNIKPFRCQKEYDEFISTMEDLNTMLETIIHELQNPDSISTLAEEIKSFKEIEGQVHEATERICNMKKEATALYMSKTSDMFAKAGGYA